MILGRSANPQTRTCDPGGDEDVSFKVFFPSQRCTYRPKNREKPVTLLSGPAGKWPIYDDLYIYKIFFLYLFPYRPFKPINQIIIISIYNTTDSHLQ